ncbi:MAG: LpxL/LpxP family acyltransferase, partial [Chloroflexota bacterium]
MFTFLVFRLGSLLVPLLPLRVGYWLASLAGDIAYTLRPQARAHVVANLRRALGDGVAEDRLAVIARSVFRNGAKNYFDLLRLPSLRLPDLEERVQLHGIEHLKSALARGKGVILISAHLGSFDTVAQLLAAWGYQVKVPAEVV